VALVPCYWSLWHWYLAAGPCGTVISGMLCCSGSKLASYSRVVSSTHPLRYKPLPSCPQYQWVVPRPFNSSARRLLSHIRRVPSSILEGGSDVPNRNLKAHGGLDQDQLVNLEPAESTTSYLLFAAGVVGTLCVWLLCRQKRSRVRNKRRLFGVLPSTI